MFDVRITEIATKRVTNYFDVDAEWVQTMDNALDPALFITSVWNTPTNDHYCDDCADEYGEPIEPHEAHSSPHVVATTELPKGWTSRYLRDHMRRHTNPSGAEAPF